ncbi:MAG: metalloregulator ArsR/SmtB family transcription factor [Candidatus Cloacimonadaceae bacterium]|jgi:ArsR family transcriptional regulator|nr:metalloregulator ArsR/SmtB family transcription factor [Candidatus Cloacimonadota bacterium]MDY0127824.1 metalloregulator ArsR/SmtB family transcription factor [Candidatus Cloacimonadaceae bacterium]MCB5254850.1 metalloregulator ArsR/SmtB family transcription factor [Candidatus Cloacimonadota bacterium]MCK9177907.1 metalloregulator ArsR/SmtB family transcription factor [Candidatus Cloacimonadota bacterium]MCK9242951.1 metalloregulator ArsR/SmtB family transcription factor [Candidatus Cloacim
MIDKCLCKLISAEEIDKILGQLPQPDTMERLAKFFKVFGDPSRLKLLYFLSRSELCVADLASLAKMGQSAVSHQLKILRLNRFVKTRKEGTVVYYSLEDMHIQSLFDVAIEHIGEEA